MAMIKAQNLKFQYERSGTVVFDGLSFQADTNWKLGLCGRNGRGKTTLLRILAGELAATGQIITDRQPVYFSAFPPVTDESARDVLQRHLAPGSGWALERELSLMGSNPDLLDRSVSTLSPGERMKGWLAALMLEDRGFLLIDEPTNHLDQEGRRKLSAYLSRKSGFLVASHDRAFLDGCVDHLLVLTKTGCNVQAGNFSSWEENRQREEQYQQMEQAKQQKEIRRMEQAAKNAACWSRRGEQEKKGKNASGLKPDKGFVGHRAAKVMKRAKSFERRMEQAVEEKKSLLLDAERQETVKLTPLSFPKKQLITAEALRLTYGERPVFGPLSLQVEQGDRIALVGKNGSGKTSLLRILLGELAPTSGVCRVAGGLKIAYLAQDEEGLGGSLSRMIREEGLDETLVKTILRKLDFSREDFETPLEALSDGQRKKVRLACNLATRAHLYLWDEPLNYLDVFARQQLEEVILRAKPTLLFVEHDAYFQERIATCRMALPAGNG